MKVESRAQLLHRFADDIEACKVVVSASDGSRQGNRCRVRACVPMHGREIEAGHASASDSNQEDPYVAVAHTFDRLRRRIEDHARRRRGDIARRAGNDA